MGITTTPDSVLAALMDVSPAPMELHAIHAIPAETGSKTFLVILANVLITITC
jgi:hypothetical protein